MSVQSQEIGTDIRNVNRGTLSKAFRIANRNISRALSFNKTPTIHPTKKRNIASPFGSNVSLTPSTISSMSHLKLQSSLTLNEIEMGRSEMGLLAPLTDQMSRRNINLPKCMDDV